MRRNREDSNVQEKQKRAEKERKAKEKADKKEEKNRKQWQARAAARAEGLIVFQENKPMVLQALEDGRVDYIDLADWSFGDRFFAFLLATGFLQFAQMSYPTPRVKEEVPVWFLTACALQLKLHCESHFLPLKHLLKSGAVLSRLKFNVGLHPGGGFNDKNGKPRETMVDQDTVRKFYLQNSCKRAANRHG